MALRSSEELSILSIPRDRLPREDAVELALSRWSQPSPYFSHGEDARSSDQGLLSSFYGGLVKSSVHNWQNGGRVLVDRTDIRILFDSYKLPLPVRSLDVCCREIDSFVREQFFTNWNVFQGTETRSLSAMKALSENWTEVLTHDVFGGSDYEPGSLLLLFFLCPLLPIYPGQPLSEEKDPINALHSKTSNLVLPESVTNGNADESIQWALMNSDWWARRVVWASEQALLFQALLFR
ncbi:MAG: hypothetical protein GKR96_04575 [Gammaproteobacteria bacterium]|nr:hypothetical protein [Gammaproteobacteria bacterium]